jgi:hypothetical protein
VRELDFVPWPYTLTIGGISRQAPENSRNAGKTDPIAGPLIVRRMTRGSNGNDYGLQIVAQTLDGKIINAAIPATRLHGDPAELARLLADRGVRILPGREKDLATYLDACRDLATKRPWMTTVAKPGWVDGDQMAFVLPDAVLGIADAIYQPAQASHMAESCDTAGALSDWKCRVANPVIHSDVGLFTLCASIAAALVRPAGSDSFGFHFCGLTSRGKTTVLQVAASVWGKGADPGTDSRAYVRRWNSTGNALEAAAAEHCDLPLCLDELGQFRNAAELGRVIYALAGGRGAERLNSNAERRAVREWRTLILSSGEISIVELMAQSGQHQKGGQALRILDIQFPGLFSGVEDAGQIVRELKQAAAECYGTAGRALVNWLIDTFKNHADAHASISQLRQQYREDLTSNEQPEIERAAERFALVRIAGDFAIKAGIIDSTPERIAAAVRSIWGMWRQTVPDVDDGKRAVLSIAQFIATHPGQFPAATDIDRLPAVVAGYYKNDGDGLYLLTDDGLRAAIGDTAKPTALAALVDAGLLFRNDGDRLKSKHQVNALNRRASFYAIKAEVLDLTADNRLICSVVSSRSPARLLNRFRRDHDPVLVGCHRQAKFLLTRRILLLHAVQLQSSLNDQRAGPTMYIGISKALSDWRYDIDCNQAA